MIIFAQNWNQCHRNTYKIREQYLKFTALGFNTYFCLLRETKWNGIRFKVLKNIEENSIEETNYLFHSV